MKKVYVVLVIIACALLYYALPTIGKIGDISANKNIRIMVAYNNAQLVKQKYILEAYKSVLQEEGMIHEPVEIFELLNLDAKQLVKYVPAIIFPDSILQSVPTEFTEWTKDYLQSGGNIAVVYDAGTKHTREYFLKKAIFADMVGLNYIKFDELNYDAFEQGKIRFVSEEKRDFFQFPYGKTLDGKVVSGYGFGSLNYAVCVNSPVREIPEQDIYANAVVPGTGEKFPALLITDYANGKVLYANLALGQLKAFGDDLPIRACMRTFLIDVVGIPHVMNVAEGKGGLIVNWHVDSADELTNLPDVIAKGFFDKELNASFHITAGDFLFREGDNRGFRAETSGRALVEEMMKRGTIGSHGGWAHNWFSFNIEDGIFGKEEIRKYIEMNNQSLEKVTGYKIREYSAPNGIYPQPDTTKTLEELGFVAYYYTGDTGSGPNRAFYNGKMVSEKVISFPVMPFRKAASFWEMHDKYHFKDEEVSFWLNSILDYTAKHHTVRLMYSHPVDIPYFEKEIAGFIAKAKSLKLQGELTVDTMGNFADFFLRVLKTDYGFVLDGNKINIALKNPEGLEKITVALPKNKVQKPADNDDYKVSEDDKYYYVIINKKDNELKLSADIFNK